MCNVTQILHLIRQGDVKASEELFPIVYEELRRLARHKMANEPAGHTLQRTALVHEAWLRLGGSDQQDWENRGHFFAAAAEAMRCLLIDRARSKKCVRHGGGLTRVDLEDVDLAANTPDETLLRVDQAVEKLAVKHPEKAQLVRLRFYAGLSVAQAASTLGLSAKKAKQHWIYARAWLYEELRHEV